MDSTRELHIPSFPATEVDPTGAGDCFLGGFAAGLLESFSLEKAIERGCYFGSKAVEEVGLPTFTSLVFMKGLCFPAGEIKHLSESGFQADF